MRERPRTGMSAERTVRVDESNRITFADERMPAILATPWLIAYLEYTARDCIAGYLEPHERSVGTYIEVEHLAPVPEGIDVVCRVKVVRVDGEEVTFRLEARDAQEPVARGLHRRRVIDADRMRRRVQRKRDAAGPHQAQ